MAEPKLEIFVLSYNRAAFLRDSLLSLYNQTFQDFRITVLDDCSTDDTAEVVRELQKEYPLAFLPNEKNSGQIFNFMRIRDLAKAPWVMAFHDDDILHPKALESMFALLDKHPACTQLSTNYVSFQSGEPVAYTNDVRLDEYWHFRDQKHYASFCFTDNTVAFCSSLYRLDALKGIEFDRECYGLMYDRVAMLEAVGKGEVCVLKAPLLHYRLHAGQVSQNRKTGPYLSNALHLAAYYAKVLGTDWKTSAGRCFVINNRAVLKSFYKWCSDRGEVSFNGFVRRALKAGAATRFSFVPRPLSRLLKKWYRKRDPYFF